MKKTIILILTILLLLSFAPESVYAESDFLFDYANLLSEDEVKKMSDLAQENSEKHKIGIYILTVDDFSEYANSIREFAEKFYLDNDLGYGEQKKGIMLTLSMAERDFWLLAYEKDGNTDFLERYVREEFLIPYFLDEFGNDEWYNGFKDYIIESDYIFDYQEKNGMITAQNNPVRDKKMETLPLIFGVIVGIIASLIITLSYRKAMNNAHLSYSAYNYLGGKNVNVTNRSDRFTHKSVSERKIHDDSDSNSSSGGDSYSSSSGGGFSGSGGKF